MLETDKCFSAGGLENWAVRVSIFVAIIAFSVIASAVCECLVFILGGVVWAFFLSDNLAFHDFGGIVLMASFVTPNENRSWIEVEFFLNLSTDEILVFDVCALQEILVELEANVS